MATSWSAAARTHALAQEPRDMGMVVQRRGLALMLVGDNNARRHQHHRRWNEGKDKDRTSWYQYQPVVAVDLEEMDRERERERVVALS